MTIENQGANLSGFKLAFEQTRAEREALPEGVVEPLSVDPYYAVQQVVRHRPMLQTLIAPCKSSLPTVDPACFERLERLALALAYSHAACTAAVEPVLPLKETSARLAELRSSLYFQLKLETRRGVVHSGWQAQLRGPKGYLNQARDVILLVTLLRIHWPQLQGKVPFTAEDLSEAEQCAHDQLTLVGERQSVKPVHTTRLTRDRAFTLLLHCLREVQRAAQFLRFYQGDTAAYVPNLNTPQKKRAKPPATVPTD